MSHKSYVGDKLPEDIQQALKSIIDEFELDEKAVRERQIRLWKKLEYYWAGFTRVWWDDVAHDWRVFDDGYGYESNGMGNYDKPINVFRAYLESIIAALSSTVPSIKCIPDDADNTLDVLTAKGGTKIASLIYKHNDAPLLWCKALFVYCTQGMIAAYHHTVVDLKFGTVSVNKFEDVESEVEVPFCTNCGSDLELDELLKDDIGTPICPTCGEVTTPEIRKEKLIIPRLVGITDEAKSRQMIEVYGGLFIKVPNWARTQAECPYLGYSYETHYTNILEKYPHLREKLGPGSGNVGESGGNEAYERWGRLSPQYYGEYPKATPTVRNWWLRPRCYEMVEDEAMRRELKKKFPNGVRCVWINEEFAEAEDEGLDDKWTLTYNPLSEYIHFDPLGLLLTSVQEISQDLISLTLQTIEHGIPQVFADPSVLNFDQYRNTEVIPGGVYPAKPKSGKSLSEGFYMVSTATLSQEVQPFSQQVQSLGQFVSGALPSLWGGEQSGSSRTAAQYSMSRNQSLQRLQTTWKMINFWWKNIYGKVIPAYIETMMEDERMVTEQHGQFMNTIIRKSELEGKIGSVEVESSEQLPATIGQIKDTMMQLVELNNPQILEALFAPENLGVAQEAMGLPGFSLPGESDREKQYEEIQLLLKSAPMPSVDPMTGMPIEMPSVMPEFEVDNHRIEGEICRAWLVGENGRQAKSDNPEGYKNVLLHLKMHIQMNQQLSAPQAPPPQMPQGEEQPQNKLRPVGK